MVKHFEAIQAYNLETYVFVTQFDIIEPATYSTVMNGANAKKWLEATVLEYNQLIENHTWDEVSESEILLGQKAFNSKWVFKVKQSANGKITQFKAKYIVKGYMQ